MKDVGCRVIVSGNVQCVGFRYFTSIEAQKLGLTGHAKNLANGDVEVLLYGRSEKIETMLQWLNKGPKTASVSKTVVSEIPYSDEYSFSTL